MSNASYPIGKFERPGTLSPADRKTKIASLASAPGKFRAAVLGLSDTQLDTPYRDGGWTVRQVIHHVADSHLNSYERFRLALTENEPAIKAYDEKKWAELSDARTAPVEISLDMLDAIHARWVLLLNSFSPADFAKTIRHSENGVMTLDDCLAMYDWHGRHHTAHITSLRAAKNW